MPFRPARRPLRLPKPGTRTAQRAFGARERSGAREHWGARTDKPEDDAHATGGAAAPLGPGHFERVGRAPLALQRICDLTPLGDALCAAHATRPLGLDGATITRYRPSDPKPFSVAFDWNRAGEPTKGGGAGQGFLRVHAIGGRLFVTDADPQVNEKSIARSTICCMK